MVIADFVAISLIIVAAFIGFKVGVGRVLNFVTSGIVGKIISIVACYFLYGLVLKLPFVQDLLDKFVAWISSSESAIVRLLLYIRIDMIAYFAVLFVIVQIIRKIIIKFIGKIFSLVPPVDKTLGVVLSLVFIIAAILILFQIVYLIFGAEGGLIGVLDGSLLGLDQIYINNPLNSIIDSFIAPIS